jgi:hypothetical protein
MKNAMCIKIRNYDYWNQNKYYLPVKDHIHELRLSKNYNIFINSLNSKEISFDLAPSLKQFVRNFVTVRWHKILCSDLGSDISDRAPLVPRSHGTCFCRFFTQKAFVFFSAKDSVYMKWISTTQIAHELPRSQPRCSQRSSIQERFQTAS